MKLDGSNALITGASAGIGWEFARQLGSRARSLVLVARRESRLEELRADLTKYYPDLIVYTRVVDLAEKSQIDALISWLEQDKIDIDVLINNAGLGDLGPFADADPDRVDHIIQVNVSALTMLTRRLVPSMIARKRGAILNVSSSAGFLPIPSFAVYAASKAYVTSFSEALRTELRGTGVRVCALCPGPVHTEFSQVAERPGRTQERSPQLTYVPVEQVVSDAIRAIEHDKPLVIPGFFMKLGMFLVRLTPMAVLRLTARLVAKRT